MVTSYSTLCSAMQFELLRLIVTLLDDAGIGHMVAGSFASTFHGEPRMTRDIDLVIDPTSDSIKQFAESLDRDRFYVGDAILAVERRDMVNVIDMTTGWAVERRDMVNVIDMTTGWAVERRDMVNVIDMTTGLAVERRDMVNVIDMTTGWKVDLIIRKDRPFSESEFGRRVAADLGGVAVCIATVEDTILAKLEWASSSGSDRQLRDVEAMLRVQNPDWSYLELWAGELGVAGLLETVRSSTDSSGS